MKVVLFCGGLGMRLREFSESIPKPLVHVGNRPILWHIMKYYAHYGHTDFILCLGWKGQMIREYFQNYSDRLPRDFVEKEKSLQELSLQAYSKEHYRSIDSIEIVLKIDNQDNIYHRVVIADSRGLPIKYNKHKYKYNYKSNDVFIHLIHYKVYFTV